MHWLYLFLAQGGIKPESCHPDNGLVGQPANTCTNAQAEKDGFWQGFHDYIAQLRPFSPTFE